MWFLSNGDFGFPFTWPLFLAKQFYIWSYQAGAANTDGIIRMPGRLLYLLVFVWFGNLTFEYCFIISSLVIAFGAFLYFARVVLEVRSRLFCWLAAAAFTLNPIVLGNMSKVSLVLAAAMLPLSLACIRNGFSRRRMRYFLLWLLLLNISLIHPFTFAVNLCVTAMYFAYEAWQFRRFVASNVPKFLAVAGVFIALNAYFLLPLAAMNTISKGSMSDAVTDAPAEYTSLVRVLNTGDVFTGLSLSKNVVKDYEFYNELYASVYFLGAFVFYVLLIALYLRVEKRVGADDRLRFAVFLGAFLLLVALSTVTFLHFDTVINVLVSLPGGWAFRSPLKWQLYIPLVLISMLAVVSKYVVKPSGRSVLYGGLALAFVLMDAYLVVDVYRKLLVPRSITYFAALAREDMAHKNLLLVDGGRCLEYKQTHPRVMTELNQVLASNNVQLKRVDYLAVDRVDLAAYDYVLSCQDIMQLPLKESYRFALAGQYVGNAFQLYRNQAARPYLYTAPGIFALPSGQARLGPKHDFVERGLEQAFDIAYAPLPGTSTVMPPADGLQDVFEALTRNNIHDGVIGEQLASVRSGPQRLYVRPGDQPLYYTGGAAELSFSSVPQPAYQRVPAWLPVDIPQRGNLRVTYTDPAYHYQNLLPNPSLEQGLWQQQVGDCYNFDANPKIAMSLDERHQTEGRRSLELSADNHIACTGPSSIPVVAGRQYLLSFDYQSVHSGSAGYYITFDDPHQSSKGGRLPDTGGGWRMFNTTVTMPRGTHAMRLVVNAYPGQDDVAEPGVARYDNFQLLAIPSVQDRFYLVSRAAAAEAEVTTAGSAEQPRKAPPVTFQALDPTRTTLHIQGAAGPFYLMTKETHNARWRLALSGGAARGFLPFGHAVAVPEAQHIMANTSMNAWYIDPSKLCAGVPAGCRRTADGGYDMDMTMEFVPQRWFYAGAILSGMALVGVAVYLVAAARREWQARGVYHYDRR